MPAECNWTLVGDMLKVRESQMEQDWEHWRADMRSVERYIVPERGWGLDASVPSASERGEKKGRDIYDPTASMAIERSSAGIFSGMTNPARPWLKLGISDQALQLSHSVREWLDNVQRLMNDTLQGSNFYKMVHDAFTELLAFGHSATGIDEHPETVIHCRTWTAGQTRIGLDGFNRPRVLLRRGKLTVRQLVERFPNADFPAAIKQQIEQSRLETEHEYRQLIEPNSDDELGKLWYLKGRPYRSIEYLPDVDADHRVLQCRGYHEWPAMVGRWNPQANDAYSKSPGTKVVSHVQQLQSESKAKLKGINKIVDPPMVSESLINVNLRPAGHTVDPKLGGNAGLRPAHDTRLPINEVRADIEDLRFQINEMLLANTFFAVTNADRTKTATETAEIAAEKLQLLGPASGVIATEMLDPLVDRVFGILLRGGRIPPAPEEMQGMDLTVEYVGVMAQAQRLVDVTGMDQFISTANRWAAEAGNPAVLDKVDFDDAVDTLAEAMGMPATVTRSDDDVAAKRQADAVAMQRQEQAEQANLASQTAKNIGDTNAENPLLDEVLGRPA